MSSVPKRCLPAWMHSTTVTMKIVTAPVLCYGAWRPAGKRSFSIFKFTGMPDQPTLEVCLSPALLPIFDTRDKIVVIIDIFRATSTISAALDNGAAAVIPVATVEECLEVHAQNPALVTAGERDGQVIPGLQYGNSPLDYQADFIAGKTLALTTTNGTRLLHMVQGADTIITGSFLNLSAVC